MAEFIDSIFLHSSKTSYKRVEGLSILLVPIVTLLVLLLLTLFVLILTTIVYCCYSRYCKKKSAVAVTDDTDRPTSTCCNTCMKALRFAIRFAFPSLDVEESEDGKLKLLGANVKNGCGKAWVYTYFVLSLTIGLTWFLALFCDQAFYKKITSCNDIDENDTGLVCFNLKDSGPDLPYGKQVDCMTETPEVVLCFLFLFSPFMTFGAAFGFLIGYLAVQRILAHVCVFLTQQKNDFVKCLAISLQLCLFLLSLGSVLILPMLGSLNDDWKYDPFRNYFFYGLQPVKIVMFGCFVLTFFWSALMPWYALEEPKNA